MKHLKKLTALLLALVLAMCLALAGCGKNGGTAEADEEPASREIFAMDTVMDLSAYGDKGEEAVQAAVEEIGRLDTLLSTGNETSEVSALNKNGGGQLSEDTNKLMREALDLYGSTDHAFDITIYPVMKLWGFADQNYKVPTEEDLDETLALVGASAVRYDAKAETVTFPDGVEIDFGGIAKGYTSDRVCDLFRDLGVTSALINLGGNVQTVGLKPDGSEWKVGIRDPEDPDGMLGVIATHDMAVITSGGYERNFEQDGVTYHHIIDPSTGYPADSGLLSVTIVARDGTLADGLSTSLFIMGKDKAAAYWRAHAEDFQFVLCEDDGTLVVSQGLKGSFEAQNENTKVEYIS